MCYKTILNLFTLPDFQFGETWLSETFSRIHVFDADVTLYKKMCRVPGYGLINHLCLCLFAAACDDDGLA